MSVCMCGCGRPTKRLERSDTAKGWVKGEFHKYVFGHNRTTGTGSHYPRKRAIGHPRADRSGFLFEHILIAEKALGRYLPPGAQVHHFDENKRNNKNGNLVICPDAGYHRLLHVRQRVKAAGGNPNTQRLCHICKKPKNFEDCVGDVTRKYCGAVHCKECARARQRVFAARRRESAA